MMASPGPAPDDDRARAVLRAHRLREVMRYSVYFLRRMEGTRELTSQQISLLTMLRPGGLRITTIAANMGVRVSTATQSVDRLSRAGYVRRDPDPTDARAVLVCLTPYGLTELALEDQRRSDRVADALCELTPRELDSLDAALPVLAKLARTQGAGGETPR
ncbi:MULTISPECIES: MarR family winged helix-turn-helix transcriptional regulator [Kocuria]|uniref:MarR family winged helix-turn-helix transcriptional regulator n=1 Tax=Kocuria TaxID=57493 RepID=UPI0006D83A67|nr:MULTISPECIES: MarR family transcriptional regulator [Kocuria]MDN5631234.1 MarR family transcriptional regulator [Kocuria sp.]